MHLQHSQRWEHRKGRFGNGKEQDNEPSSQQRQTRMLGCAPHDPVIKEFVWQLIGNACPHRGTRAGAAQLCRPTVADQPAVLAERGDHGDHRDRDDELHQEQWASIGALLIFICAVFALTLYVVQPAAEGAG
jgi:hypothetical protein